jgi:hypothetical protein
VHHCAIQINHQPDATVFQFIILTFIYSSTCFRRSPAHHQELNDCSSSLWFYLRIVVIAVLLFVVGPAGRKRHLTSQRELLAIIFIYRNLLLGFGSVFDSKISRKNHKYPYLPHQDLVWRSFFEGLICLECLDFFFFFWGGGKRASRMSKDVDFMELISKILH